jgi:membrane protease YdiL (CAAX protease family)
MEGSSLSMPKNSGAAPASRRLTWLLFAILAFASLGLLTVVDDTAWFVARQHVPALAFIAHFRVPSLLVCLTLAFVVGGCDAFRLPADGSTRWRTIAFIAVGWLIGTCAVVLGARVWTPPLAFRGWADYFSFLFSGLLAEELLFRGTLQPLAATLLPEGMLLRPGPAIWLVAALFALSHLQYHSFQFTPALAMQTAYVLPMGVILGGLRAETRSLWPAVVLHLATNVISTARVLLT